jgi:glycerol-3-phosphate dehydrogenase
VSLQVVINATGPFADGVRKQSNAAAASSVTGSSGTHVTLPEFYGSRAVGMIIPKTKDGRVLFMLPWQVRQGGGGQEAAWFLQ